MKKTLILLTENHMDELEKIFDRIPIESVDEVICIDYQSSDGTAEFLKKKGIPIISQDIPGPGAGIRIALERSSGEILTFFIPNGVEDPEDISLLFEKIEMGNDLVIASRFIKGGRNSEYKKIIRLKEWLSRMFINGVNTLWNTRKNLFDPLNSFFSARKDALQRLNPDQSSSLINLQIAIRALKLHLRIGEIPTNEAVQTDKKKKIGFQPRLGHLKVFFLEILNGYGFERKVIE